MLKDFESLNQCLVFLQINKELYLKSNRDNDHIVFRLMRCENLDIHKNEEKKIWKIRVVND